MSRFYTVDKTFGHDRGLSCCFRQWRADHSHCSKLHGYAIGVSFRFVAVGLDARNWVIDFGGFDAIKTELTRLFDHTTIIARDDPAREHFEKLFDAGLIDLRLLPHVGCERFAELIFLLFENWLGEPLPDGVYLARVTVSEHAGNSASYNSNEYMKHV